MLIIPISEEEKRIIERNLDRDNAESYVAKVLLFSTSPLASPRKVNNLDIEESNFIKQEFINKFEDVIGCNQEKEKKYSDLQKKIYKFGGGK